MSDEELDAIESRCGEGKTRRGGPSPHDEWLWSEGRWFSTAAREYIPALIAEVRRLRESARADSGV